MSDELILQVAAAFDAAGFARFRANDETVRAYARYLADIDPRLIAAACMALGETAERMPTPRAIRRECGRLAGLAVAPSLDQAWRAAQDAALWERNHLTTGEREGRPDLHPAVAETYGAVGGMSEVLAGGPTVRAQFRDWYLLAAERADTALIGAGSPALGAVVFGQLGRAQREIPRGT